MITTDSGPRHFAAAFDVPVISLFGPTHIAWTRTYHPHAHPPVPPGAVRAVPEAGLPAGAPPLHERIDARCRFPDCGTTSGRVPGPSAASRGLTLVTAGEIGAGLARDGRVGFPRPTLFWRRSANSGVETIALGRRCPTAGPFGAFRGGRSRGPRECRAGRPSREARCRDPRGGANAPDQSAIVSTGRTPWRRSTCSTPCARKDARAGSCWPVRRPNSGRSTSNRFRSARTTRVVRSTPTG